MRLNRLLNEIFTLKLTFHQLLPFKKMSAHPTAFIDKPRVPVVFIEFTKAVTFRKCIIVERSTQRIRQAILCARSQTVARYAFEYFSFVDFCIFICVKKTELLDNFCRSEIKKRCEKCYERVYIHF